MSTINQSLTNETAAVKNAHNKNADALEKSFLASANTERRLASHCATSSEREKHLRKAHRYERKAKEAIETRV